MELVWNFLHEVIPTLARGLYCILTVCGLNQSYVVLVHVKYRPCSKSTVAFVLVTFSVQHLYTRTFVLVLYGQVWMCINSYANHKPLILTKLCMYVCPCQYLPCHMSMSPLPHVNAPPATCRCRRAWVDCGALPQRSTGWWPPLSVASGPTLTSSS